MRLRSVPATAPEPGRLIRALEQFAERVQGEEPRSNAKAVGDAGLSMSLKQAVIAASAQELRDLFIVPRFGTLPGGLLQILAAESLKQHRALMSTGVGTYFEMAALGNLMNIEPLVASESA